MRLSPCEGCPLPNQPCISGEFRSGEYCSPHPSPTPVMVLGAAGGWQEEQQLRPFVGPSGAELARALFKAGITEYYATNAAACIPPEHGEPEHSAVKACRTRLEEEINAVRPRFIIALGNVAIQRLLGKGTVTALSGKEQWSGKYGAWILPAYHPAFLLRSPGRRSAWLLDLIRYGHLIRGDIPLPGKPPIRVAIAETLGDLSGLYQRLREEDWVFDFETSLLPWWHTDFSAKCVGFAFGGSESTVLFLDHPDNPLDPRLGLALLRRLDTSGKRHRRIGHNAGMFDCLVWYRLTGQIPYLSDDTMVKCHLLDENEPKGLKWQGRAKLNWPSWDIETAQKSLTKPKRKKKDDPAPEAPQLSAEDFAFYCGADTCATYLINDLTDDLLQRDDRLWAYYRKVEMPKVRALSRLVARGIYVDSERLGRQWSLAAANWSAAKEKVPVENPASADQVAEWLFGSESYTWDGREVSQLGLEPLHRGKKHGSTQEEDINRLALAHPEVRVILPVRKWQRYQTTYFRPIHEHVRDAVDGRYHPDIRVAGAERRVGGGENSAPVTGRLASAFHTVPRPTPEDGAFVRQIFSAPEGYSLIECDYEQLESRLCAWAAAGRPDSWEGVVPAHAHMLLAYKEGRKIYEEQASQNIYGTPLKWHLITKNERQMMGKVPVLAMGYRISPKGLMEYAWREFQIDWSLKEAGRVWMGFHRLWPEFQAWHEREERILRSRGYAQTVIGRYRRLPAAMEWGRVAQDAIQAGINSPIQGLGSDITQMALVILDALYETGRVPFRVVGDVHDALQSETPKGTEVAAARVMKRVMEREALRYLGGLGLHLPPGLLKVECKVGAWGQGKVIE
jgi:uracil-DNA glycosylase